MIVDHKISLFHLVHSMSKAIDLISPSVVNHHKRVAYIALSIAIEMDFSVEQQNQILLAGLLHDSGAFSLEERLNLMEFEIENPHTHAENGYRLLKSFEPFNEISRIIKYHHFHWDNGFGKFDGEETVPMGSFILHLADRIDILLDKRQNALRQAKDIIAKIEEMKERVFNPDCVEAFKNLASKEFFWLDMTNQDLEPILVSKTVLSTIVLDFKTLMEYSKIFSRIIDFRSKFTVTHSNGIAATSEALAKLYHFSPRECLTMRVAGYLHDLGKLAVPKEILEKPDKLTEDEFNVVKSHTYYTFRILEPVRGFEVIREWGAFHHERLDGKGYPFHHDETVLSLGSRIMAVADVFTAITEDRPYRRGMADQAAKKILMNMSGHALDPDIVSTLMKYYDEITAVRKAAQTPESDYYKEILQ